MTDIPFHLAALNDALAGTEFHGHLQHFPSVPSTSDLATAAAQAGARHGVWIADEQTAGRGRGTHTWHSAPGDGIYLTALTTPPVPVQSVLRLSFATAIAVQSAISSLYGFRIPGEIDIRWPNDLLLAREGRPARKVGGILIDTASRPAAPPAPALLRYAVIGIGINLNHLAFPPELDPIATSIRRELPADLPLREEQEHSTRSVENSTKCLPREPLAAAILRALATEIHLLSSDIGQQTSDIGHRNPESHSTWLRGKRVRVEPRADQPGGYTGTTAGLDPHGFLRITTDDGQLHTVLTGGLREP